MDIAAFDVKAAAGAGADLHLKHPSTDEPLLCKDGSPFVVQVLGKDAKAVQEASRKSKELHAKGDIDDDESGLMVLCAAVIGWSDEMELDGKALKYTPENVRKLLSDPRTDWIVEQITPFSLRRRNFAQNMKAS